GSRRQSNRKAAALERTRNRRIASATIRRDVNPKHHHREIERLPISRVG
ncbi:MAG: hypothetical protein ACI9XZ_003640, partial [Alphaproteobacteria bacterium]